LELPRIFDRVAGAYLPQPQRRRIFNGDWAAFEDEGRGLKVHFILHIPNTEDELMALLACPDEKFEGAVASK
jgi:hypothetical protein